MTHLTKPAFTEERKEGDPDLVAEITSFIANYTPIEADDPPPHPNPTNWLAAPDVQEAALPCPPKLQLFLINRHWRVTLGRCKDSTVAERYCLMDGDDIDFRAYLESFRQNVVPRIVKEQL